MEAVFSEWLGLVRLACNSVSFEHQLCEGPRAQVVEAPRDPYTKRVLPLGQVLATHPHMSNLGMGSASPHAGEAHHKVVVERGAEVRACRVAYVKGRQDAEELVQVRFDEEASSNAANCKTTS